MDLNPVVALPDGPLAVDARVRVETPPARPALAVGRVASTRSPGRPPAQVTATLDGADERTSRPAARSASSASSSSSHAWWRAANYLSVGQIYLLENPLLREPLRARARQAAPARPLGHDARAELRLRPPQPLIRARDLNMIYVTGPGHGGPGSSRAPISRGPTARSTLTSAATRRGCAGSSASSLSRAGFRATSPPRHRDRSTRAASSATRSCTPTAPRSTTRS